MHAAEDGGGVDQPVQFLPPPAEPAHGPRRRGRGQRHEQEQGGEPGRDVGPLDDVGAELRPVGCLVHEQVPEEVHRDVEEGKQAEHAPEQLQPRPAQQHAQRRHRQRREQQAQAPDPERVLDLFDGIRAQRPRRRGRPVAPLQAGDACRQPGGGPQAQEKDDRLGVAPDGVVRVH